MANNKASTKETVLLKQEIANLKIKNAKLEEVSKKSNKTTKPVKRHGRKILIGVFAALATLLLVFGNIFFWTGRTLVDTNRYVSTVGPLIKQPPIQSAIAQYTTDQVFNNFDVQGYIKSILPPKAGILAPELTSQVKNYTQTTIKSLLNNSKVQSFWYSSLTKRHTALISFSKSYTGNGTIDVSDIYGQLSKRLSTTQLSFLANKQLPDKVGSIKITTVGWLPAFHKLVTNIDLYQFITTSLFIITSGLAIFLSSRRLRMVVKLGLVYAFFMLITVLAVKIMRGVFVSNIHQTYQAAAQAAYDTILKSFVSQTYSILIISLLVSLAAGITDKFNLINKAKPQLLKLRQKIAPKNSKAIIKK